MGKKDPRIDAYIEKSAPFAQPILKRLRKLIHVACPVRVNEASLRPGARGLTSAPRRHADSWRLR